MQCVPPRLRDMNKHFHGLASIRAAMISRERAIVIDTLYYLYHPPSTPSLYAGGFHCHAVYRAMANVSITQNADRLYFVDVTPAFALHAARPPHAA